MFSIGLCSVLALVIILRCFEGADGLTNSQPTTFNIYQCVVQVISVFERGRSSCTGCYINREFLLTVAHTTKGANCFYALNKREVYFGKKLYVRSDVNWNIPPLLSDIALLRTSPIRDGSSIIPARYCQFCEPQEPLQAVVVKSNAPLSLYSCAIPSNLPSFTATVEYIDVSVVSNDEGFANFPGFGSWSVNRTDIFFAVGMNKTAGDGDSGGSVLQTRSINGVTYFYLHGLISFGKTDSSRGLPFGISKVKFYYQWITDIINAIAWND